jgi:hypothetical protein
MGSLLARYGLALERLEQLPYDLLPLLQKFADPLDGIAQT